MILDSTTWHKCPDCGRRYDWANQSNECPHALNRQPGEATPDSVSVTPTFECMMDGNCRRNFEECEQAGRCLAAHPAAPPSDVVERAREIAGPVLAQIARWTAESPRDWNSRANLTFNQVYSLYRALAERAEAAAAARAELEAATAVFDDEEAAHADTLRLLKLREAERDAALKALRGEDEEFLKRLAVQLYGTDWAALTEQLREDIRMAHEGSPP